MTTAIREVRISHADGIEVQPVLIRIDSGLPEPAYGEAGYAQRSAERFRAEGTALAEALWESCPGGTIDALLSALLARRASMFRVRFPQEAAQ